MGTMVETIQPISPLNLLNNMVQVFANTGNTLPKQRGTKSELAASPLPSRGSTRGRKCYVTPAFSGVTKQRGDKIRIGCLTVAFLGAHKRAEVLCNPCILGGPQTKGDKIRIGCPTHAFSGAHKRAEVLHNPCILGGPQQRRQNQKSKPTLGVTMMPLLVSQSMGL